MRNILMTTDLPDRFMFLMASCFSSSTFRIQKKRREEDTSVPRFALPSCPLFPRSGSRPPVTTARLSTEADDISGEMGKNRVGQTSYAQNFRPSHFREDSASSRWKPRCDWKDQESGLLGSTD